MSAIVLWKRIPVIIRAVLIGFLVAGAGTTPWAILVNLNFKYVSFVPWAVPITAVYLWLFWRYLQGEGWPQSTAEIRKQICRANSLSDDTWSAALLAGIAGLVFIVLFQSVLSRMVAVPTQPSQHLPHVSILTLFFSVVMSAIVAGVAEEAAFRGYMQKPLEKRYGPLIALLVVGVAFGFAHFSHPKVTIAFMPYYLTVAAVYGMLAYLTNSVFPSMVLHAGGNMLSSLGFVMTRSMEEQVKAKSAPLIWETGTDTTFWISSGAALIVGTISVLAYRRLAIVARKESLIKN